MTKKLTLCLTVGFLAGLLPRPVRAASAPGLIPPGRAIVWQAGVPGGIPYRTNIFTSVKSPPYSAAGDGIADDWSAFQSAFNACPSNQVVYIPPGIYRITNSLTLKNNGVTVRGAGTTNTILTYAGPATQTFIYLTQGNAYGVTNNLAVDAPKDATSITLSTASGISVGDVLLIDSDNDHVLVDSQGMQGPCAWCGRTTANGVRALSQMIQVTGVNGTTVSFTPPLSWNYTVALNAQTVKFNRMIRGSGLEDMLLDGSGCNATYAVTFQDTLGCWVKDVEAAQWQRRGVWLYYSLWGEIRDNYFHEACAGYSPDHGYGIVVALSSTANLIENNIYYSLHNPMAIEAGATRNVFAYNFSTNIIYRDTNWLQSDAMSHGAHPIMNLWEGNVLQKIQADLIWGTSSHQTYFRNWVKGTQAGDVNGLWTILFDQRNYYMNVLGNVLGVPGTPAVYQLALGPSAISDAGIYRLGYTNSGQFGGPGGDTNVITSLLRHGNFDFSTMSTIWDPTIAQTNLPPSLYLAAKPPWWGRSPWPAIGPDTIPVNGRIPAQTRFDFIMLGGAAPVAPQNLRIQQ